MAHNRSLRSLVLATVLSLGVAACGSPVGETGTTAASDAEGVFTQFQDMDPNQRMDALVKAAKEEGTVVAYLRADVVGRELEQAFEAKYDIDLQQLNPGTNTVVRQQILEQSKAGRLEADIVEAYMHELALVYKQENVVAAMPEFLKEDLIADGMSTDVGLEVYQYTFLPAWNTNIVTGGNVPTSLEGFTGPQFQDRLVMVSNYEMPYKALFDYLTKEKGMGTDEFANLFRAIGANTSVTDSGNPAAAFLASGQYLGGINMSLTSMKKAGNVPIAYQPVVAPVASIPLGIGLLRDAPHPAAAMLFAHWYITEGQSILQKEMYIEQSPEETDLRGAAMGRLSYDDLDPQRLEEWRVAYDNMIRGKEDVLPEYITASN